MSVANASKVTIKVLERCTLVLSVSAVSAALSLLIAITVTCIQIIDSLGLYCCVIFRRMS